MVILKILLLLIVLVPLLAWAFGRCYKIERRPDVIHYVKTADGWNLALSRYGAVKEKGRKKRLPVLLCHGLSGNHHNWDISERLSVARTLAAAGYEVFALDLRGSGYSDRPRWFSPRRWDWDFDTHLIYDIPAAVDKVLAVTGAKQLHYIGHSMGGMLAYAFLQTDLAAKIKSAVILASPGRLDNYQPALKLLPLLKLFPVIHLGVFSKFGAPLGELWPGLARAVGNLDLPRGHVALAMANTVENVPRPLFLQFARFAGKDRLILKDGTDVTAGLSKIKTPMLFLVGSSDKTIAPETVKEVHDAVRSEKKAFHILGPEHGHQAEYGHQSVQFGRYADREAYPVILNWLAAN